MRSLILALLLCPALAVASLTPPDEVVRKATQEVVDLIQQNLDEIRREPRRGAEMVESVVSRHFDFDLMARFVLARAWADATPELQQRFLHEFREMLIRTYAHSLADYSGETVEVIGQQGDPERGRVTVRTLLRRPAAQDIPIDYGMRRTDEGWKVFDIIVEGVSLVQNYRSSFATEIRNGGLEGLVQRLADRNRRGVTQ